MITTKNTPFYQALRLAAHNYRANERLPGGGFVMLKAKPFTVQAKEQGGWRPFIACGWVSGSIVDGVPSAESRSWEPEIWAVANDQPDRLVRIFVSIGGDDYNGAAGWCEVVTYERAPLDAVKPQVVCSFSVEAAGVGGGQ